MPPGSSSRSSWCLTSSRRALRKRASRVIDSLQLPEELLNGDGVVTVPQRALKGAGKVTRTMLDHISIKQDPKVMQQILDALSSAACKVAKAASMSNPERVPVADLLVRRLMDHGVRHIFGYPGGQLTPIYDALARTPAIRHYLARHEQAAAFMADGYARATGKPGVCLAVCGPGVMNAATPLMTAFTDSMPVLLISGQVPSKGRGPALGVLP